MSGLSANDGQQKKTVLGKRSPTVTTAILAVTIALVFLVTFFVSIPIPGATQGQVFDAGDIMVFIAALTFGPMIGGIAGGIGSALSDALTPGGGIFAPFTLIIKGSEGLIAGYVSHRALRGREFAGWLLGSLMMVAGYLLAESYFIGLAFGSSFAPGVAAALIELPFNVLQVFAGGVVGIPISRVLRNSLPSILYPASAAGMATPTKN